MSLEEFEELVRSHDWYYMMADDSRAYEKGYKHMLKIEKGLRDLPEAREIYERYKPTIEARH
jgi:hypothetical protein